MKILFLTWKTLFHPKKGGAEVVMGQYAKYFSQFGHEVTWVGSGYHGCEKIFQKDNITYLHIFGLYTIYFLIPVYYFIFLRRKYDIVIDEAGGVPFWFFLYGKEKTVFFIHHLGEKEWESLPFGIGKIARKIFYTLLQLYKNIPTFTVSNSTKKDLENLGWQEKNLFVLPNTLDMEVPNISNIEKENTLLFYGRLTPMKRVEDAIKAFALIHKELPQYSLRIIGPAQEPTYFQSLQDLVKELGLEEKVDFFGGITLENRHLLAKHKLILIPSHKEGYGLVALEANMYAIPALGYDVGGLRDAIIPGKNGYICPEGDTAALAQLAIELLKNNEQNLPSLAQSSYEHAKNIHSWEENARVFEEKLKGL